MQIDGDAQAGNDGFNIGAGKGGGMAGSAAAAWAPAPTSQYLAGVFQRLLRETRSCARPTRCRPMCG
jgi:hypothetical protein